MLAGKSDLDVSIMGINPNLIVADNDRYRGITFAVDCETQILFHLYLSPLFHNSRERDDTTRPTASRNSLREIARALVES